MPYNIWCNGCGIHIAMGVRYNAEKKKIGKYYSTVIYKFRMRCHLCENYFEIQTDPQNCDYKILSGARRKEERWSQKDNEQIETTEHEVKKKLKTDPMFKLEHVRKDADKLVKKIPSLQEMQEKQDKLMKDDYQLHRDLRKKFRTEKKRITAQSEEDLKLMNGSTSLKLLEANDEDERLARLHMLEKVVKADKTETPIFKSKKEATEKDKLIKLLSQNSKKKPLKTPDSSGLKRKLTGVKIHKKQKKLEFAKEKGETSSAKEVKFRIKKKVLPL